MGVFFWYVYIYDNMNSTKLKNQILEIFEEIETDIKNELVSESLSGAYSKLAKFLLNQVKTGKFLRNYDIDTNTGRMVFNTKSGKKIVFNDMKIGVTANKIWKGKKKSDFFSYKDLDKILKFSLADI